MWTYLLFLPLVLCDLTICNYHYSNSIIAVAFAYTDTSNFWTAKGWFHIVSQGCEIVYSGNLLSVDYYVKAVRSDTLAVISNADTLVCATENVFDIFYYSICPVNTTLQYFQDFYVGFAFDYTVDVGTPPYVPPFSSPTSPSGSPASPSTDVNLTIGLIVGGLCICVIGCIVGGVCYCRRSNKPPPPVGGTGNTTVIHNYSTPDPYINRASSVAYDFPTKPLTDEVKELERKRNRFADGLNEEIHVDYIEFYHDDHVPKQSIVDDIKYHNGNVLCEKAMAHGDVVKRSELSPEEVAAIYVYTAETDFYPELNTVMRSGDPGKYLKFQDYIYYLTSALKKLEPVGKSVYRCIDCKVEGYVPGKKICWRAFSSSTLDPKVAITFLKSKKGTIFLITPKTPRSIDKFSAVYSEQEVLFLPNSTFLIKSEMDAPTKQMVESMAGCTLDGVTFLVLEEI